MNYNTEVILLSNTPGPEKLIEFAGRVCYNSQDHMGEKADIIQTWIKSGHESMLEHASATFLIIASRAFSHEIVRHRLASYSQRSQRYVDEKKALYITPPEFSNEDGLKYDDLMKEIFSVYEDLGKRYPKQLARYVLPNACETTIVCTWNFRELRHIIRLRTSSRALPEMREVAGKIRDICRDLAPSVFEDLCQEGD